MIIFTSLAYGAPVDGPGPGSRAAPGVLWRRPDATEALAEVRRAYAIQQARQAGRHPDRTAGRGFEMDMAESRRALELSISTAVDQRPTTQRRMKGMNYDPEHPDYSDGLPFNEADIKHQIRLARKHRMSRDEALALVLPLHPVSERRLGSLTDIEVHRIFNEEWPAE
jgi:hypothetical protein